jgi:hypothetical protein
VGRSSGDTDEGKALASSPRPRVMSPLAMHATIGAQNTDGPAPANNGVTNVAVVELKQCR